MSPRRVKVQPKPYTSSYNTDGVEVIDLIPDCPPKMKKGQIPFECTQLNHDVKRKSRKSPKKEEEKEDEENNIQFDRMNFDNDEGEYTFEEGVV